MRTLLALTAAIAAPGAAYLGHIGYLGGSVFTRLAATAQAPLTERGLAAVLLSGDMGFEVGMSPRIAHRLAADGIPVTGVNSLTYFRRRRTPAETEALIARAIGAALAFGRADRVVLIGQSFGADMLQVGLARLPQELRAKVRLVILVVPGDTVAFRASPSELFNFGQGESDAIATAHQLGWAPVLCIHGADEKRSLCPRLHLPNIRDVTLPGGHPLHRDADAVYRVIFRAIQASSAATSHSAFGGSARRSDPPRQETFAQGEAAP